MEVVLQAMITTVMCPSTAFFGLRLNFWASSADVVCLMSSCDLNGDGYVLSNQPPT